MGFNMSENPTQKTMQNKAKDTSDPEEKQGLHALSLPAGLYLVSTPIGNLRDITFRALDTLSSVDLVACEDTRVTGKLLSAYNIKKKMLSYNDHATQGKRTKIIEAIENGQSVALVSDAGAPLISDPGYKLVRETMQAGHKVTSIPGANAAVTALQLSGLPSDKFFFGGFLPAKTGARKKFLEPFQDIEASLIFYETGPRLEDSLKDIKSVLGERPVALARELTKMYEEIKRESISSLLSTIRQKGAPKGEIVLVIGQPEPEEIPLQNLEEQIRSALETMSVRDAAESVAAATGKPKKAIYTLALKLSGK